MQFKNGKIYFDELKSGERTWQIVIDSDTYLSANDIKDNHNAYLYTIYGQNTKTQSAKTVVVGKNIGRSNQTTNLEQAIKQAQSMISKKTKAGYGSESVKEESGRLFPMAVSPFDPKKIKFPMMAQPKLDGIRMIASLEKLQSRRLHDIIMFDHVKKETDLLIGDLPINFIDGELYLHEMPLQEISGIVRGSDQEKKFSLEYHIFDACFQDPLTFQERIAILNDAFAQHNFTFLKLVDTVMLENEQQADEYFEDLVNQKYEGIIYKPLNAIYEASSVKEKRSTKYVKRKLQHDEEFEIVDFTEGVGKFKGLIVFILKTKEGLTFNCVPMGDAEYRKKLYTECSTDFKLKGKLATVKFDAWSKDKVPLRAVIINIDRID